MIKQNPYCASECPLRRSCNVDLGSGPSEEVVDLCEEMHTLAYQGLAHVALDGKVPQAGEDGSPLRRRRMAMAIDALANIAVRKGFGVSPDHAIAMSVAQGIKR